MYFVDPRRVTIAFGIIRRATVCGVRGNRPNSVTSGDGMEGVVYGAQLSMRASARLAYQPPPLAWQTFETLLTSWAQAADPFGPRHPPKSTPGNASFLALTRISRAPSVILFTPSPLCCRHTSCYKSRSSAGFGKGSSCSSPFLHLPRYLPICWLVSFEVVAYGLTAPARSSTRRQLGRGPVPMIDFPELPAAGLVLWRLQGSDVDQPGWTTRLPAAHERLEATTRVVRLRRSWR